MAAYIIAEIEVTDPETYKEYLAQVGPIVEKYGGSFIVRGGRTALLEGDGTAGRMVVIEFPDMDALNRLYNSAEYAGPEKIRLRSANSRLVTVEVP